MWHGGCPDSGLECWECCWGWWMICQADLYIDRQIRSLRINCKNIYQQLYDREILLTFIYVIINVTCRWVYAKKNLGAGTSTYMLSFYVMFSWCFYLKLINVSSQLLLKFYRVVRQHFCNLIFNCIICNKWFFILSATWSEFLSKKEKNNNRKKAVGDYGRWKI